MQKNIAYPVFILAFLASAAGIFTVFGQGGAYISADWNQAARTAKGADPRILPAAYLWEYDPITVFYDRDVVMGGVGPIEPPAAPLLTIVPAHPGEYIKINGRTLEFRPAVPWSLHNKYRITAGKSVRELVSLLPLPQGLHPDAGSMDLEPVGRIGLEFFAKVDPQALSRLVTFEVCPLPGVDGKECKTLKPTEYSVMESVGSAEEYLYYFTFNEPIGYGQKIRLILKLAERAEFKETRRIYTFETRPEFMMASVGVSYSDMLTLSADGVNYDARQARKFGSDGLIVINFTAPPADPGLTGVKNMVSMTPSPSEFGYRVDGDRIVINPQIEPEKLYKITLNPVPLKDSAGRILTNRKPSSFYAYQPKVTPFAEWGPRSGGWGGDGSSTDGIGVGIVERFGPQHFPIRTRGVSSLDFRVYKVDPLHSAIIHFPSDVSVSVYEASRPPSPGEEPGRLDSVIAKAGGRFSNYALTAELGKHIAMLGSPHYSEIVDLDMVGVNKFQSIDLKPMFATVGRKDRPGSYLVGFRQLDGADNRRHYVRVDVTDLCLSVVEAKDRVLFAVTSYANGGTVSDAQIRVYGIVDDTMGILAQGKTGADGIFTLLHTQETKKRFEKADIRRIAVSKGDDMLAVLTGRRGELQVFADNHWHGGLSSTLDWFKENEYSEKRDKKVRGFLRTDRPIYRLEDSVYIKGYVRETMHGKINLPPKDMSYWLTVRGPSQAPVDYPVTPSEFGSFDLRIVLHEPSVGEYHVSLRCESKDTKVSTIASTDFAVEAYRAPSFEVRLSGAERIPNDAPSEVRAAAAYYAGGLVANQNIAWKVTSYPYNHQPRGFAGYFLSSDGRYGAVTEAQNRRRSVFEENAKTDENGSARITLNPQAATLGDPARYVVEATVIDANRQTVLARHSVIALPPFTLGLRTDRHITGGSTIAARVVAIGVNDSLVAGQKVGVELKRVSWTSYLVETDFSRGKPEYVTNETIDLIEEKVIVTNGKPTLVEFKDQQPGVYILELSSRDRLGRLQSVKTDLFLAGGAQYAWKKPARNVFETVTDRNYYEPGQQAKILIKSPYKKALVLAILERPTGGIQHNWININNGQGAFTFDIKQEMSPRIPVSFLLMRPRASMPRRTPEGILADTGKPETIGNTTWLTVNPVANTLNVRLTHTPTTAPNATFDVTVSIRDIQGKPWAGEVALWLVDEAVLSRRKEKALDPLEAFIEEVSSRVTIRDSRNLAFGNPHTVENYSGGGDFDDDDDGLGKITVRQNLKTVPYWNPSIKVDRSGNAVVKIPVSSDLTSYSVRAMAISGPDRFGAAKSRVVVRH